MRNTNYPKKSIAAAKGGGTSNRKKAKKSSTKKGQTIMMLPIIPQPYDVRLGRGKGSFDTLGNQRYRSIISEYQPIYWNATGSKMGIAQEAIQAIKRCDEQPVVRFLKKLNREDIADHDAQLGGASPDDDGVLWREATDSETLIFTQYRLREKRKSWEHYDLDPLPLNHESCLRPFHEVLDNLYVTELSLAPPPSWALSSSEEDREEFTHAKKPQAPSSDTFFEKADHDKLNMKRSRKKTSKSSKDTKTAVVQELRNRTSKARKMKEYEFVPRQMELIEQTKAENWKIFLALCRDGQPGDKNCHEYPFGDNQLSITDEQVVPV